MSPQNYRSQDDRKTLFSQRHGNPDSYYDSTLFLEPVQATYLHCAEIQSLVLKASGNELQILDGITQPSQPSAASAGTTGASSQPSAASGGITGAPPQLSAASAGTTGAPPQPSAASAGTTGAPPQPSAASAGTTSAPPQPSAASAGTTGAPPQPSAASAGTTGAPPQPSAASAGTTGAPPQLSAASAGTTGAPPQLSAASAGTTGAPPQPFAASAGTIGAPPQPSAASAGTTGAPPQPLNGKVPLKWKDLPLPLKSIIPSQYTYVIEEYSESATTLTLRINIADESEVKKWLAEMYECSKCTYRVTRTYKPGKRLQYRVDMHCQHQQKPLSVRQKGAKALSQKKSNPLMGELRNKKTNCPSKLTIKIAEPTKKELYGQHKDVFLSHKTQLQLTFGHNHPIHSAHALSFRPISQLTEEKYYKLFSSGHSAASARHYYETTLMDMAEGDDLQQTLSDRSLNPVLQDVNRLYNKWRLSEYGTNSEGKDLADSLVEEVAQYNRNNAASGGKASVQVYDAESDYNDTDSEDDDKPAKPKKRKKLSHSKPLIITACTPLMARVHSHVQQAREMIFCDSTSCLEKYNCSLFIISTSSSAGGLPLGVAITSDEKQSTITRALQSLLKIVPEGSFYGSKEGPAVIMTDDSAVARSALAQVWPKSNLLLCTFHFLQRRWTWLFDSKNKIKHEHRAQLIDNIKQLVYSKTVKDLEDTYIKLKQDTTVLLYPNFLLHMAALWPKRQEWALCYRSTQLTRGNNTNNISEAGIKIVKDIIFGRIKAYNLIQMFQFVTDALENYIKRKLLNIAHNRFDNFISRKFKGLLADRIEKSDISVASVSKNIFHVNSQSEPTKHIVDMEIGTCSCEKGKNGAPCSHQAAVVYHYHIKSINYIPIQASQRQDLAYIALGEKARKDSGFYASLHEDLHEDHGTVKPTEDTSDFSGSAWDVIRAGALSDNDPDDETVEILDTDKKEDLIKKIVEMSEALKTKLNSNDPQLIPGIEKFLLKFHELSSLPSDGRLASALHQFGAEYRRGTSISCGQRRWGKRIGVQATATGRRKYGSRGRGPVVAGRPRVSYTNKSKQREKNSRYTIPVRRKNQVDKKRAHNLSLEH